MKPAVGLFLSAIVVATMGYCANGLAAPLSLAGYQITFNEEFTKLNITARGPGAPWIAHTPWNGDFGDAAFDDPGAGGPFAVTKNGLAITAHRDAAGKWHSGLICSVDRDGAGAKGFAQQYGYFEMKAKIPSGPGTWPAFWLVGTNKTKSSAEIDVLEYYGAFGKYFHSTEHIWVDGKDQLGAAHETEVPDGELSTQYNTFGVLITARTTSFYMNRNEIWSTPTPPEYRQPMYILANLALGGGWPINRLQSPQVMNIQYIRAYQAIGK
jgi:hypothetical protein